MSTSVQHNKSNGLFKFISAVENGDHLSVSSHPNSSLFVFQIFGDKSGRTIVIPKCDAIILRDYLNEALCEE